MAQSFLFNNIEVKFKQNKDWWIQIQLVKNTGSI
jgi:hypothetical protein